MNVKVVEAENAFPLKAGDLVEGYWYVTELGCVAIRVGDNLAYIKQGVTDVQSYMYVGKVSAYPASAFRKLDPGSTITFKV